MKRFIITSQEIKSNCLTEIKKINRDMPTQEVIIQDYKEDKSAAQRGYWHMLIGIFAQHCGMSKEDMKSELKRQILGVKEYEFKGEKRERESSSEEEKKHGYTVLIEETLRIAAEMGCVLPSPNIMRKNDEYYG